MMSAAVTEAEATPGRGGIDSIDQHSDYFGSGGGRDGNLGYDTAQIGLWVLLGSLTMLFAAFTSAYLVRQTASDWVRIDLMPLLWVNTAVLLASSVSMELARRRFATEETTSFRRWVSMTLFLGVLFLAGQFVVWQQLGRAGFYLASNPHSSFFYLLTGVHAVHLMAGLGTLLYVLTQSWRRRLIAGRSNAIGLSATYWHFVGVVWVYLFFVLFLL